MNGARREVVVRGLAAVRRSAVWWAVGIFVFDLVNLAFWPSLRDSEALRSLESSSGDLLAAFGAAGIATPAGYLDGQVFALLLPLLLSGMALAMVTALTAGDEDAGRLELVHALPVGRRTIWLGRLLSVVCTVALVTAAVAATLMVFLSVFDLAEAGYLRVLTATAACGLLALFHASVGFAAAAAGLGRARAVVVGVVVLAAGYLASAVLPLADALEPARYASPWYWAIRTQPVTDGVAAAGWLALVACTVVLAALGAVLVERRDIKAA